MHGHGVGLGPGEAFKSYAGNGSQRVVVYVELPMEHAPGDEKGELDNVTLSAAAKVAPHGDDFGNRGIEAFHDRKQLGAGLLVALAAPGFRCFAAFRDRRELKLVQVFTQGRDGLASTIRRTFLDSLMVIGGGPVHHGEHHGLDAGRVFAIQNLG